MAENEVPDEVAEAPEAPVAYLLNVNMENLPRGEVIQIPGLGEFENGSTYKVTIEESETFRSYHSQTVSSTTKKGNLTSKVILGPTLLQASKQMYGVEVTPAKSDGGNK